MQIRQKTWGGLLGSLLAAAAAVIAAGTLTAGEYHVGDQNVCSDCHVSHASIQGVPMTPSPNLLKNAGGEIPLCLSCHDGTDLRAPDIVATGTSGVPSSAVANNYASKYGSSAGFFQMDFLSSPNPAAHDLTPGVPVPAPLSNSYTSTHSLLCSDCHDPHGTPNYRNLVSDPNPNHAGTFSITLGTHVRELVPVDAVNPNPDIAYNTSNVALFANNNISNWCADCHDQLAENTMGSSPAHFRGHPSNTDIGAGGAHTDVSNWLSGLSAANTGFGIDIGDLTAGIPRLRYGSSTGSNTVAGATDRVSCLSCHKAHGSKYRSGLVWPYKEGGADGIAACQQCHFK